MFEGLLGNNEEKKQMAAEGRQMDFTREQNSLAVNTPEERSDILLNESKSDLIRWQQDLDEELESLAMQLTGMVKVNGEWQRIPNKTPLCNDRFMEDVVKPQCTPFVSRNLINSNFSEDRILMDLRCTSDDITDNMADGFDIYGVEFTNYDIVLRLIKNTIKAGAFRALNGWTKKTDSTTFKKIESSMDNQGGQPKQKGIFGIPS